MTERTAEQVVHQAQAALARARRLLAQGLASQPVVADVLLAGKKIGHVVSDESALGTSWTFYPTGREQRRVWKLRHIETAPVLPKWCADANFGPFLPARQYGGRNP